MYYVPMDPLRPIGKNRSEYFLIEYESFIINMAEALIQQSFYHPNYTLQRYPDMKKYWGMTGFGRYIATEKFTPFQILSVLNDANLTDSEIQKDLEMYQKADVLPTMTDTTFAYLITQLCQTEFVKRIHIIKNGELLKHEYFHLKRMYSINDMKDIQYFAGDIPSICKDYEYTTIMMNGVKNVRDLINSDPEKYQNVLFLVHPMFDEHDFCEDLIKKKYNIRIVEINYTGIDKLLHPNQPMG